MSYPTNSGDASTEPFYDIKGIPVRPGQKTPCRYECSVWATNSDDNIQVSLFIRALQMMYGAPIDDPLSFFQIASIHGYPGNLEWNHGGKPTFLNDPKDTAHYIYCTHNTPLFPTWHRPYMLLFEQRLYQLMLKAIDGMSFQVASEKQEWIDQACEWRMPYWDWGLVELNGIPAIFTTPTIKIRQPRNEDGSIATPLEPDNPLNRYQTKDVKTGTLLPMGQLPAPYTVPDDQWGPPTLPWSQCAGTSRWGIYGSPVPSDQVAGVNNWKQTNEAIATHDFYKKSGDKNTGIQTHTVSELVYRLLDPGNVPTWKAFSTTLYQKTDPDTWTDYANIEYIHNNLHNFIGGLSVKTGLGHMSDVPVAAFDPVFFFHHCNIDRQLAIWQALNPYDINNPSVNPDRWFNPNDPAFKTVNGKTELAPFHHLKGGEWKFWNSDDVYSTAALGYEYDVLQRLSDETDAEYRTRIIASLDRYSNTGQVLLQNFQPAALGLDSEVAVTEQHVFPDYIISVIYDRYALKGAPYTIQFFLDQVSAEEINDSKFGAEYHPRHVGSVHNFSATTGFDKPTCPNCAQQTTEGALSTALVPLTLPLYDVATDPSFDGVWKITPEEVEKFLIPALTWKATDFTGNVVPWDQLPRTRIMVLKGQGRHYHSEERMSAYSGYIPMEEVTRGKPCGAEREQYGDPTKNL
jgi:tyrosinase